MTLELGNQIYDIKNFNYSLDRVEHDDLSITLRERVSCNFLDDIEIDTLSDEILNDFEGSFTINLKDTDYEFSGYEFNLFDYTENNEQEGNAWIYFLKNIE